MAVSEEGSKKIRDGIVAQCYSSFIYNSNFVRVWEDKLLHSTCLLHSCCNTYTHWDDLKWSIILAQIGFSLPLCFNLSYNSLENNDNLSQWNEFNGSGRKWHERNLVTYTEHYDDAVTIFFTSYWSWNRTTHLRLICFENMRVEIENKFTWCRDDWSFFPLKMWILFSLSGNLQVLCTLSA